MLAGGSIYWVIRGHIRVRQRVTGFRSERDDNGRRYCLIEVDEILVPTLSRAWRPFQGWRYLSPEDAPADRSDERRGAARSDARRAALARPDLSWRSVNFLWRRPGHGGSRVLP